MRTLYLPLKSKWYRMIESLIKGEEYRTINHYWAFRLYDCDNPKQRKLCKELAKKDPSRITCNECDLARRISYDRVTLTLGYPKSDDASRRMTFQFKDLVCGRGNPEWGAPTDKEVFIIKLGERTDDI